MAGGDTTSGYLDLRALAAPNGGRYVIESDAALLPVGSAELSRAMAIDLEGRGLAVAQLPAPAFGGGRLAAFAAADVPIAAIYGGTSERKTATQAEVFGGAVGEPHDACAGTPCDDLEHLDETLLLELLRAAAALDR